MHLLSVLSTFPHHDISSQLDTFSHITATVTEKRAVLDLPFLGVFPKLQKWTVGFICMEQLGSH
jgi:hypothetical protein